MTRVTMWFPQPSPSVQSSLTFSFSPFGEAWADKKVLCTGEEELSTGKEESRFFWIDALCINQIDHSEKTKQVQMMETIFQTASETAVWLGPE